MNETLFTNRAGIYHIYRPSYPKELIDHLYTDAGFGKDSVIVDIGSGTGIFSRLLIERGSHVYCVEPNDDMRSVAEKELGNMSGFVSISAQAENTGLNKKSVDFVTTAQAFHWFDSQGFHRECCRMLKKSGKVVIVWNIRDFGHEIVKKDYAIRKKYCVGDAKGLSSAEDPINDVKSFFVDADIEELTFANDLHLARDDYIGMNLSRSYSPTQDKDPEKYFALISALGEIFDEYSKNGVLLYPHFTKAYIGSVTASPP